jgi:tetratricopeptide (TPR) repeat protein
MQNTRFLFRWVSAAIVLALACALPLESVNAKYMMPDLVNVPVERLIKNLELLARNDPKNVEVRFNLARAHAMAYAQRTESVQVWKGRENEGVWFGYNPQHVPFTVKPITDNTRLEAANAHLAKASELYAEVVELAPDNLAAALGHAWCLAQSGQKQKAVREYRKVIKAGWEKENDLKFAGLGWHSVTAEAAGYLIPLLAKDEDKEEINTLQERIKQMGTVRRPITPIVIPLRDRVAARDLENHSANVAFDADGTGLQKRWTWITRDAGWVVYDSHHTGTVTSALQLFGGVTFWMFWENGYQALGGLDDDGDGILAGKELEGLAIWQDINGNGISERGEVKPLAEWGIVAISCRYVRDLKRPDRIAYSPRGVFFRDGSNRPTYDIILHPAIATVD